MTLAAQPDPAGSVAPPAAPGDWWRDAVVYQIYPRSFADSDGDGMGDLPGITARLAALAELGVDAVWLSPFYRSPQVDGGYDVADYREVDPLFGTLDDFDEMLARAHELGLKMIVDLIPNHSSDRHAWFVQALAAGPGSPARERYIFRDGKGADGSEPPNNWLSVFGGPAWTRVTEPDGRAGQWYLHLFEAAQPDFNWSNAEVRVEFDAVLRFWLDRGVDGFRVDVAHGLVKEAGLPDFTPDPRHGPMGFAPPTAKAARLHRLEDLDGYTGSLAAPAESKLGPMWDQDGVHEIYRHWRTVVEEYRPPRILVAEAWVQPLPRLARYVRPDEMHLTFNFDFLETPWYGPILQDVIQRSVRINDAVGAPTTWVLSNHDVIRHPTRFALPPGRRPNGIGADDPQPDEALGARRGRAATLTMLALPGSAYLYQGEELGLPEHTTLDDALRQDPTWRRSGHTVRGRDGCRVPIPWEADRPALGFSPTGKSWLPQPDSFGPLARDRQLEDPGSTLTLYRTALRLRRKLGLGRGTLDWLTGAGGNVLAYRNGAITVLANMGTFPVPLPPGEVLLGSAPLPDDGTLPADTTVWLG